MAFVNQAKDLTFDYDAVAGATLTVFTDLPGGGPTILRRTITLPATTARASFTAPLDIPSFLEGTLFRFKVASGGIVRLYSGIVRIRRVGVYFDGAAGETWQSQEMAFS